MKKPPVRAVVPVVLIAAAVAALLWFRRDGAGDGDLTASGTVEATTADLGFQIPGRIAVIAVSEGARVRAGDTLARLDTRELEAALAAARAQAEAARARLTELERGARPQELAAAEAAYRSARRRAENARRDLERARRLYDGGAVSRQRLDAAETALAVAEAAETQARQQLELLREGPRAETVAAQRALVAQALAGVRRAEAALAHAVVVAPFSGLVTVRHREVGETVGAGMPVLTLLDPGDRWVRIYVREDRVGALQVGMAADVTSDTYPGKSYRGEVIHIGSEAEFTPRNIQTAEDRVKLVYPVKVRITGDPDFELKPGIPADVVLHGASGGAGAAH